MPTHGKLAEYRRKRDFRKTQEPAGAEGRGHRGALQFVVQKHAASRLHFDFRLELDGVLKSWAIPKGPSLDPAEKRLAIEVEDHPIEYGTFEGTIAEGEYGAGVVMLWDRGTYTADDGAGDPVAAVRRGYERGELGFTLHGERLRGSWVLVRISPRSGERARWLLVKRRDAYARPGSDVAAEYTTSVATGRTMEEIASGTPATRAREAPPALRGEEGMSRGARSLSATPLEPMAARIGTAVPEGPGWTFEPKYDGIRVLATRAPRTGATQAAAKATHRAKRRPSRSDTLPRPLGPILSQLEAIERSGGDGVVRITRGKTLEVSNLAKVFFPDDGYTKGDLMRYYGRVAPVLLPLIADRPLVLKRSPDGIDGETFFQQRPPASAPAVVRVERVETENGEEDRLVGGDLATLLYAVQLGCISIDPWLSRVRTIDEPDFAVLDLDPGPEAPFARIVEVARWIYQEMQGLALHGAVKTSGARGLHVALPLPPRISYDDALRLAQRLARRVAEAHPDAVTLQRAIRTRPPGTVYVDYLQNARGKSVAAAYSARAKPGATVSTPLAWDELRENLEPDAFTIATVPTRLEGVGDLWGVALKAKNTRRTLRRAADL